MPPTPPSLRWHSSPLLPSSPCRPGRILPPTEIPTSTWIAGSPTASPPTVAPASCSQNLESRASMRQHEPRSASFGCDYRTRVTSTFHPAPQNRATGRSRRRLETTSTNSRRTAPTVKPLPPSASCTPSSTVDSRSSTGLDLPEHAQLELIGLFDTMYGGTLLFPNPDMPYMVAATTWTNLLGCRSHLEAPTLAAIEAFGRATWGRFGGEPVIGLKPAAPTPGS